MQLTAIFGAPGAGKARHVVETVLAGRGMPGGVFLVVPGPIDRSRYLRELAAREPMLLDVEVGSWSTLVQRLAAAPARPTDRVLERIVVRDALATVPELAGALRYSGFVDTARRVAGELRVAAVWGEREVERVTATLPGGPPAAWRRLADRAGELYDERRLHDAAWFEQRAARRLDRGVASVGAVVVVEHAAPSSIRVQLIERLARSIPVTVALPWRPGRELHDPVSRLRDRWTGADTGSVVVRDVETSTHDAVPLLEWMSSELFEPAPTSPPEQEEAVPPIGFVSCCGRSQELQEVVREVALLVDAGLAPGAIAVAAARVGVDDAERIAAMLEKSGIPASPMVKRTAPDTPAGRALLDLVSAIATDDPRRLVAALAGAIVPVGAVEVRRADLALRGAPHVDGISAALSLPAIRAAVPGEIVSLAAAARSGAGILPPLRSLLATLRPHSEGDLRLLTALVAAVESLATAAGGAASVRIEDVVARIEQHPLEVADHTDEDAVTIAPIGDLGSLRVDGFVTWGYDDGAFRASADDEGDVPDAARDLVHLAVSRARRALRVLRRAAGDDGGMIAPHPVWRELDRLASLVPEHLVQRRDRRLGDVVVTPADVVLPGERAASVTIARAAGIMVGGVEPDVEAAISGAAYVPAPEQLGGAPLERIASLRRIAATELEAFSKCPVQWLLARELGVRDPDESRAAMVAGSYAHALLERVAPALHARGTGIGRDEVRAEIRAARDEARRCADRAGLLEPHEVDAVELQVESTLASEHENGWSRPDDVLTEVAIDSRKAYPDPAVAGSVGGVAPPWRTCGLDVDGVEVHGRIDRIDVYGSEAVLHDYKAGRTKVSPAQLVARHQLQLPLYWLALRRNDSAPDPVAAVYRRIRDEGALDGLRSGRLKDLGLLGRRDRPPKDDVIEQVLADAELRAREILDAMRSGVLDTSHIDPGSGQSSPCTHCSFAGTCRIDDRQRSRLADASGSARAVDVEVRS